MITMTTSTTPMTRSSIAPSGRTTSASIPSDVPMLAIRTPTTVKDSATPALSATPPNRCVATAEPIRIGTSGNTQGDSVDSSPAMRLTP